MSKLSSFATGVVTGGIIYLGVTYHMNTSFRDIERHLHWNVKGKAAATAAIDGSSSKSAKANNDSKYIVEEKSNVSSAISNATSTLTEDLSKKLKTSWTSSVEKVHNAAVSAYHQMQDVPSGKKPAQQKTSEPSLESGANNEEKNE